MYVPASAGGDTLEFGIWRLAGEGRGRGRGGQIFQPIFTASKHIADHEFGAC